MVIHGNTAQSENITAFNLDFQENYDVRNSASWKSSNLKLFCKKNDENKIPWNPNLPELDPEDDPGPKLLRRWFRFDDLEFLE